MQQDDERRFDRASLELHDALAANLDRPLAGTGQPALRGESPLQRPFGTPRQQGGSQHRARQPCRQQDAARERAPPRAHFALASSAACTELRVIGW